MQVSADKRGVVDVHASLRTDAGSFAVYECVRGSYVFFHYGSDGENDAGWGCAYRSLQTIISWFLLQNAPMISLESVPSLLEIQRTIAEVEDKPLDFVGSRDWIGAVEVAVFLDSVGIRARIINVADGAKVKERAAEIARHFQTQGTPVMAGGGVRAITILGVRQRTISACEFLVLDPHYSGSDDAENILQGEAVSWRKSSQVFKKGKFYNLCLPQRLPAQ